MARTARPDVGSYSPKELAAKENTTTTSVYSWIDHGLPVMRRGNKGNILIHYQDYIQWMIDCARAERTERDIPSWAYRFVKAASPRRGTPQARAQTPREDGIVADPYGNTRERENDSRTQENGREIQLSLFVE